MSDFSNFDFLNQLSQSMKLNAKLNDLFSSSTFAIAQAIRSSVATPGLDAVRAAAEAVKFESPAVMRIQQEAQQWGNLVTSSAVSAITQGMAKDLGVSQALKAVNTSIMPSYLEQLRAESWTASLSDAQLSSLVSFQHSVLAASMMSFKTEAIGNMLGCFREGALLPGYESLLRGLQSSIVAGPDLALLRSVNGLGDMLESMDKGTLPPGTKTFVRNLSVGAARRLSQSDEVKADLTEKRLFVADTSAEDNRISTQAKPYNVLAAALIVFEELTDYDMFELQQICDEDPAFARDCKAGKFIWEHIRDWKNVIGFDKDTFFHARTKKKGSVPYTKAQMSKAPEQYVSYGRYNATEKSYYYFADTEEGAVKEVSKHDKENEDVQVAELQGEGSIKLIDLSLQGREPNYFLKYIRFPFTNTNMKIPTEYLVPNFVAQCCRRSHLDGIKYYGSKAYNNYVVWDDDRVKIIHMKIMPDRVLM